MAFFFCDFSGIGALMFALPKLISGDYQPKNVKQGGLDICNLNKTFVTSCGGQSMSESNVIAVLFFIANFIMGVGTTPLYTLGKKYFNIFILY